MNVRSTLFLFYPAVSDARVFCDISVPQQVNGRRVHKTIRGVVTKAAGGLAIKTPQGTTYQLNENQSKHHGASAL